MQCLPKPRWHNGNCAKREGPAQWEFQIKPQAVDGIATSPGTPAGLSEGVANSTSLLQRDYCVQARSGGLPPGLGANQPGAGRSQRSARASSRREAVLTKPFRWRDAMNSSTVITGLRNRSRIALNAPSTAMGSRSS